MKKKTKHIVTIELEDNKVKNIVKDTIHANRYWNIYIGFSK